MASLTWWTWVWVSSGSWWWTGKPGVLQSLGSQRVGHGWVICTCTFHFHEEAFEFLFTFCHKGGVICISEVLIFLPAISIPAWASSRPAFLMMYSAYKLNKQSDNIQPWHTPFPIWNQSVVPCPVLTVASFRWFIKVLHQILLASCFLLVTSYLFMLGTMNYFA